MADTGSQAADAERIWSVREIRAFLDHDDPEIRKWALRRLRTSAGPDELASAVRQQLADPDPSVAHQAYHAAVDLSDERLPSKHLSRLRDRLREYAERDAIDPFVRGRCLGVLAALGDDEAREAMFERAGEEPVGWLDWASRETQEFADAVVERLPDDGLPPDSELCQAVLESGNPRLAGPLLDIVDELDGDRQTRRFGDIVGRAGGQFGELPPAEEMGWVPIDEIDRVLRPAAELIDAERDRERVERQAEAAREDDWERFGELSLETLDILEEAGLGELDSELVDWALGSARALRDRPSFGATDKRRARLAWHLELAARLAYGIETTLQSDAELGEKLAVFSETMGHAQLRFREFLESMWAESAGSPASRADLAETLLEWLDAAEGGAYIGRLSVLYRLDGLDLSDGLERFLDEFVLSDSGDELPNPEWELLEDLLERHPDVFERRADELLEASGTARLTAFSALGQTNAKWASDLLVDRLDELLRTEEGPEVWDAIAELGDSDALEAVLDEWQPGEPPITRCAGVLAKLGDRFDTLDDALRDAYDRLDESDGDPHARLEQLLEPGSPEVELFADEPLTLPLRCTECGRTYHYDVHQVLVDLEAVDRDEQPDLEGMLVAARIIDCKHCGALDRYEFPARSRATVLPYLYKLTDPRTEIEPGRISDARVALTDFELWDGTTLRRPSEAIDHAEQLAEKRSDEPEAWVRLGNLCERFEEWSRAVEAWRRAIEVGEHQIEAAYSLAEAARERSEFDFDAAEYLRPALEWYPEGEAYSVARTDLAWPLVELLEELVDERGEPRALQVASRPEERAGKATVDHSSVDLRRLTNWDRLAQMFAEDAFLVVTCTADAPDQPGRLERFLDSEPSPVEASGGAALEPGRSTTAGKSSRNEPYVKSEEEKVGRNDPCPCGSGRKYKRCCLRK